MESEAALPPHQDRWVQRAERIRDAFGLVLILVLISYVLASIVTNKGWGAVALTVTTAATAVSP